MKNALFALLFVPFLLFSQEESSVRVGVFVLPELNGLTTANSEGREVVNEKVGFSAGMNIEFPLNDHFSIRSGIGYGLKRYGHSLEGLIFNSDIDPQSGVISESRLESSISNSEIQLPVMLQFKFKSPFFIALGVEVNGSFGDNSKRTIYFGSGSTFELMNSSGVFLNYSTMMSFGYLVPSTGFSIEPQFKYYLKQYIIPQAHQYNLGLKVVYNFLK